MLLIHAAGTVENVHASASSPTRTQARDLLRYGARIGVESGWYVSEHVALLFGIEGTLLFPPFTLNVEGSRVGEQAIPNWGANVGIRLGR